jgi:hypothetical protein
MRSVSGSRILTSVTTQFTSGLDLARGYYHEVVGPLLDPLPHSAALIGTGSEILGFDTPRSTDHNWGLRLQVFAAAADTDRAFGMITEGLPATWRGHPTAFTQADLPGAVARHWVTVTDPGTWWRGQLGFDPRAGITVADWLATPTQRLAENTGGAVFHDGLGALEPAGAALAWYPDDVWAYVLACQWRRIAEEEAFPGRCAEVGDDLGSAVVTARLVRDLMRLCLLMNRRYPPYSKWLGSAFARLPAIDALRADLIATLAASDYPTRERHLAAAYRAVADRHNQLGSTAPLDTTTRLYYDRPYQVLDAGRFVTALRAAIAAPDLRDRPLTGAVDQFVDNTDALGDLTLTRAAIR